MKKLLWPFTLTLLVLAGPAAEARAKKQKVVVPPPPTSFSVSVPQGEIDVGSRIVEEEDRPLPAYEISASSWSPDSFLRNSYTGRTSSFERSGMPALGLSRIAPVSWWSNGAVLAWKVGLGFVNLQRESITNIVGVNFYGTQSLSLVSARGGVEYQALRLVGGWLQPYAGFSLLPTFAMSSRSQLEERVNKFGLGFESTLGVLVRPPVLEDFGGFRQGALGLGLVHTFGSVDGSELRGFGFQALFRVSL